MNPPRTLRCAARLAGGSQFRRLTRRLPPAPVMTPELAGRDGGEYEPVTAADLTAVRQEGRDGVPAPAARAGFMDREAG
jgi:hypothetical protein